MEENDKVLILRLLIKATFVLLFISVVLKLLGLNVFGVDTSNAILNSIANVLNNVFIKMVLDFTLLIAQNYLIYSLCCHNKSKSLKLFYAIISAIIIILFQYLLFEVNNDISKRLMNYIYIAFSILITVVIPLFIDRKINKNNNFFNKIKLPFEISILIIIYQGIVIFIRNLSYVPALNSLYDVVLNFDYTILLMATYYLCLKKDTHTELNSYFEFSLTKLLDERLSFDDVKVLVLKYNDFKKKFKESNKTDKVIIVLYLFFAILSEIINLSLVVFVAYLNNVLIECFFIITSFLISRKVFGAFHLDSAIKCWFMSNISFYLLDKLTLNVGITFVIPILCGIMLSYITSKFIKKNNKDLYKGMTEKDLIDLSNNKRLTTLEYEILKKYYCEGINMNKLTFMYHYSRAQLYRYKSNAEKKIAS
jgi:hypothetical protein